MNYINKYFFIKRNEQTARQIYGDKIDNNRRVIGTNIWFDSFWRIHTDSLPIEIKLEEK